MSVRRVPLLRTMSGRDTGEAHRASTPLELFFDLVLVVSIASGAAQLHHGLAEGHLEAAIGFVLVFFAVWWAWLNYSWFASAYDTDDVLFRVLTFAIMVGSLTLAAGVPDLFEDGQSAIVVGGYCLMRLAMVVLWLRAAAGHAERRRTCLTYAAGISVVQVLWVARLLVHDEAWLVPTFLVGVVLELAVPYVAERRGFTPFHPEHMAERYSLFTIIVLGEVVLSTMVAVQQALAHPTLDLVLLIAGALLVVFSMWWIYFKGELVGLFRSSRLAIVTEVGYGHVLVFGSVAAAGAALAAAVDVVTHHAHTTPQLVGLALAVPLAGYAATMAFLHRSPSQPRSDLVVVAVLVVALLATPFLGLSMGVAVLVMGLLLAAVVVRHVVAPAS